MTTSQISAALKLQDVHFSYDSRALAKTKKNPKESFTRPRLEALSGLSFEVSFGKITGLLGPNGSGKSTSFKLLSTQLIAERGDLEVCGLSVAKNPSQVRSVLGVTFQSPSLDPILSVSENLQIHAALMGLNAIESKEQISLRLEQMGLSERAQDPVKELSGGLARRAELAKTLLSNPKVLLLDEPTTGLDPTARRDFWKILRDFVSPENAVFVTTHLMEEAELCDDLIFISEGRVSAQGSPSQLKKEFEKEVMQLESDDLETLRQRLQPLLNPDEVCMLMHNYLRIETLRSLEWIKILSESSNFGLKGLTWTRGTLADVYFKKTGKVLNS